MIDRLRKLRTLVEVQAEMCLAQIDAAIAEVEVEAEDAEPEGLACPACGESDGERIEDTTAMGEGKRLTCLSCGKSFYPGGESG